MTTRLTIVLFYLLQACLASCGTSEERTHSIFPREARLRTGDVVMRRGLGFASHAVTSMIASKADQTLAKKQGIKGYEILSEEVTPAEENKPETAVVKVKIEYGDASTKEETVKLKKDDAGDWKIDMGK